MRFVGPNPTTAILRPLLVYAMADRQRRADAAWRERELREIAEVLEDTDEANREEWGAE